LHAGLQQEFDPLSKALVLPNQAFFVHRRGEKMSEPETGEGGAAPTSAQRDDLMPAMR